MGERVFIILILIVPAKLSLNKAAQFTLLLTVNKKFCFLTLHVMKIYNICQSGEKYKLNVVLICISLIIIEVEHIFWCMWTFALLFYFFELPLKIHFLILSWTYFIYQLIHCIGLTFLCYIFCIYFLLIASLSLNNVLPSSLIKKLFSCGKIFVIILILSSYFYVS